MQLTIPAIRELMGRDYACACGRTHRIRTRRVALEADAAGRLPGHIRELDLPEDILLIADENTWAAAGASVAAGLQEAGMRVNSHVLAGGPVHADEHAVGSVMLAAEPQPALLIAVGSGSMNDLGRFCAARMKIPYLTVATAASVDGYASNVTPVMRGGLKITYPGIHPEMIAADPAVLAAAPRAMLAAGLGDLIGKRTAGLDWRLAEVVTGEFRCPVIAGMMEKALGDCIALAPELAGGSPTAAAALMEALVLAGLAMQMQGNSRPASGCEHHISHFLEMRDALQGRPSALHGDKVGAACLLVMKMYERFFSGDPPPRGPVPDGASLESEIRRAYGPVADAILRDREQTSPKAREAGLPALVRHWDEFGQQARRLPPLGREYRDALRMTGGPVTLAELGYSRDDVRDALLYARLVRPRFTLLSLLHDWGRLESMTEEILDDCQ